MTREDFASLALGYLEEVTAFARRLSRNAADADDLVQGTFERAFRSWRDLREPGSCRAWLFRIARNLHLNRQRSAGTRPELRLVDDEEGLAAGAVVSAEVVERLEAHDLEAALARVPVDERDAVLLCDLIERLMSYTWPGNARELENVVERAAILAGGPLIEIDRDLLPTSPAADDAARTA